MDNFNSVMSRRSTRMVAAAAAALAGIAGIYVYQQNRYRLVGHVSHLVIYPVKSCKGVDVDEAHCGELGLESHGTEDRRYTVITGRNNRCVTQRQHPELALVCPSIDDDDLILNAPGMPQLRVQHYHKWEGGWSSRRLMVKKWDKQMEALDCGDEAAEWLDRYLNQRTRGKSSASTSDEEGKQKDEFRLAVHPWEFGGVTAQLVATVREEKIVLGEDRDKAAFSDRAPYLLLNTSSLDSLNRELVSNGKSPVAVENFRPNFVVTPVSDHDTPFEEDTWERIVIGKRTSFRYYKPCQRCRLTVVDPEVGDFRPDNEPLTTLKRVRSPQTAMGKKLFNSQPLFCLMLAPDKLGCARVGDPVYAKIGQKFVGSI